MDQRNSSKIEIIKKEILEVFNFLEEEYYYKPEFKVEESEVFIESLEVEYTNEIRRRNIIISYTKGKVYNEIKYTFGASITRIPDAGNEDFFSLSNYLESIGKDFDTSLVDTFDEVKARKIIKRIADVLKEYVSDIIEGRIWLETYYPRKD